MWFVDLRLKPGPSASVADPKQVTAFSVDEPASGRISANPYLFPQNALDGLVAAAQDKRVVLVTHGFNVGLKDGLNSLSALGQYLRRSLGAQADDFLIVGVLWPGDFNHLAVNYVWEHIDAVQAGKTLGQLLDDPRFDRVRELNFISHSLGARVVLSCLQTVKRRTFNEVCMTAAAADADAFRKQYATVPPRAGRIRVLASRADKVLMLAYPPGDFIADVFKGDDDSPLVAAMGRVGAKPVPANLLNYRIESTFLWLDKSPEKNFDHGDYYPDIVTQNGAVEADTIADEKARKTAIQAGAAFDPKPETDVTRHLARILLGQTPTWPPPL